jgi:hypothetical protein
MVRELDGVDDVDVPAEELEGERSSLVAYGAKDSVNPSSVDSE